MIRMRAAHFAAFRAPIRRRFIERVAEFLRERIPSHVSHFNDLQLSGLIEDALPRLEAAGIGQEFELMQTVGLLALTDWRADHDVDWIRAGLHDSEEDETRRVYQLIVSARQAGVADIDRIDMYDDA